MKILLSILTFLLFQQASSQREYTISFDSEGKLKTTLPDTVFKGDKLGFIFNTTEDFTKYESALKSKLTKANGLLTQLLADVEKMDVLEEVYGITSSDIRSIMGEIGIVLAKPVDPASASPHVPSFLQKDKSYLTLRVDNSTTPFNVDFEPNVTSGLYTISLPPKEIQAGFTLSKKEPFRKLVFNWLQSSKSDFNVSFNAAGIPDLQRKIKPLIEDINSKLTIHSSFFKHLVKLTKDSFDVIARNNILATRLQDSMEKIIVLLDPLIERSSSLVTSIRSRTNLSRNKEWMLKWLWYQSSAMPALNPLGFKSDDGLGIEPDTSMLASLRIKIASREDLVKNTDYKKINIPQLDSLLSVIDSLKLLYKNIEQKSKSYRDAVSVNNKNSAAFRTTGSQLNKGILISGSRTGADKMIYWMRHHDAANRYQLMNLSSVDEYLETDQTVILTHNLKENERADIKISFTEITNDASFVTGELSPLFKKLSDAVSSIGRIGSPNDNFTNSLINLKNTIADKTAELKTQVATLILLNKSIDYLLQQNNPDLSAEENTDKTSGYHSQVANPAKKMQGPKKATYYLNTVVSGDTSKSKIVPDTFSYRINKLYRFFPMAGFAYTFNNFATISTDSAGNKSTLSAEPRVHFILGVKVFLRKTDIRSNKIFFRRDHNGQALWPSRLSVNLAVDVKKPLDNLFTGVGLDIWPGLCINGGVIANKYKYVEYSNGSATNTRNPYRIGFYAGISTDISLFTDFAKFFNLIK